MCRHIGVLIENFVELRIYFMKSWIMWYWYNFTVLWYNAFD